MKIIRFYGLGYNEVNQMPYDEFLDFIAGLDILWNQEMLRDTFVMNWPYMKQGERQRQHKEFHKRAHPDIWEKPRATSLEKLKDVIKGIING